MSATVARYDAEARTLVASGDWRTASLQTPPEPADPPARVLDGSGLTRLDPNGAWLLLRAARPNAADALPELRGFAPAHRALLDLVAKAEAAARAPVAAPPRSLSTLAGLGGAALWDYFAGMAAFLGRLALEVLRLLPHPGRWRWRELAAQVRDIFVDAIPIVAGMLFLLGVVFAYLLGSQAQQYGANIFVVDGLLLAILREISPVIVAVLVAGRTGAAITAQLGTMKVTEEIDAVATLGLSPLALLVIPRMLALLLAMPLLVFLGDIAGVAGGMLVAREQLDISFAMFADRANDVLQLKTFLLGLFKAPAFAAAIALIACRMGLSVSRDARSVGAHTTSTVVQSLVAIILLNAIFAVMFVRLHI